MKLIDKHLEFKKSIIEGVELKSCRDTHHSYKAHVHNELSLGYIVDGETNLTFCSESFHYKKGDGVIIPPLTTHRCEPKDVSDWAYIMLYIDPEFYKGALLFNQAELINGSKANKLIDFINMLMDETDKLVLESLLVELLNEFGEMKNETHTGSVEDIRAYLIEHVYDVISLDQLEALFKMSKFTLIRKFKEHYNTTPSSFHLQLRISEAKKLIAEGKDVLDVCAILNFYDQPHFIKEFKKVHGITPKAYKDQLT